RPEHRWASLVGDGTRGRRPARCSHAPTLSSTYVPNSMPTMVSSESSLRTGTAACPGISCSLPEAASPPAWLENGLLPAPGAIQQHETILAATSGGGGTANRSRAGVAAAWVHEHRPSP